MGAKLQNDNNADFLSRTITTEALLFIARPPIFTRIIGETVTKCVRPPIMHKLRWVLVAAISVFLVTYRPAHSADNVIDGFRAFAGDCMRPATGNISQLALPFLGNLLSGGMKAIGGVLTSYGEDSDATFSATVNLEGWDTNKQCLHIVHGPIYTNSAAFDLDKTPILEKLPLPWGLSIAQRAKNLTGAGLSEAQAQIDARKGISSDVETALKSSGALLAGSPKFFAEIRIAQTAKKDAFVFRLRSLYYSESLHDSWFRRTSAKAIVLTVGPYSHDKPIKDSLGDGYSIPFANLPSKSESPRLSWRLFGLSESDFR